MTVRCWSAVLADCAGTQSEEHYISQSIIGHTHVIVSGLPFLRGETRTLPSKRLARNMLCRHHNTVLSPLDAAAGDFFKVLKAFKHRAVMRARGGRKRGGPDIYKVDGALVERWLLKTLVNVMFGRETAGGEWSPPEMWVRCIHGLEAFPDQCGFYFLTGEGLIYEHDESALGLRILTLTPTDDTVIGAQFCIEDLRIAVSMQPLLAGYRIPLFRERRQARLLQLIHFDWSNLPHSHV